MVREMEIMLAIRGNNRSNQFEFSVETGRGSVWKEGVNLLFIHPSLTEHE